LINSFLNNIGIFAIPVSGEAFFIAVIVLGAWFWHSLKPKPIQKKTVKRGNQNED
jgi:hypothetical protein